MQDGHLESEYGESKNDIGASMYVALVLHWATERTLTDAEQPPA